MKSLSFLRFVLDSDNSNDWKKLQNSQHRRCCWSSALKKVDQWENFILNIPLMTAAACLKGAYFVKMGFGRFCFGDAFCFYFMVAIGERPSLTTLLLSCALPWVSRSTMQPVPARHEGNQCGCCTSVPCQRQLAMVRFQQCFFPATRCIFSESGCSRNLINIHNEKIFPGGRENLSKFSKFF